MAIESFEPTMVLAVLPEIFLVVLAGVILAYDAIKKPESKRILGWITAVGLLVVMILSLLLSTPSNQGRLIFGGMLRQDWLGFAFMILFMFAAAITALFTIDMKGVGQRGEFYVLLLISTLGMCLMASSADIIMLYLAIETTSIPMYILAGFLTRDDKSTESGFKYLLFGAAASTVMLYGFSLLYGFTGQTNIYQIALSFFDTGLAKITIIGILLLILVGFSFKISAFPFHFWAPDVYEGAPTPIAGFLSTASKAAGFVVVLRVLVSVFTPAAAPEWMNYLAVISLLTMTIGNVLALAQKNIKRLLAYSSIAHAGYILIGVVAMSQLGMTSVVFYLIAYLITNLAAFGVVLIFSHVVGSDDVLAYSGLSRRKPWLAFAMLIAFLSLAGMPPLAGFIAKVFVFAAAVKAEYIWLAFLGVINSIIGLYYYLTVLKYVYLYRSDDEEKPLVIARPYAIALSLLVLGILLVGTLFGPWFNLSSQIASSLF
ncbi:MAG: NADH-quinone oxidoreductase subunit N [Anaerolineales bacterium]|nr:MAG: NADH-quinone oxidoreductase subunit N [Anaerolineales bacterium]